MAQEIRDVVFNIQVRTEDGKVKIDGLTKGFVNAESAFKKMQTTLKTTNEAINKTGVNTGLANTAVLEFGRTISDAPYGIQGMGNNITQLVTIMGQLSEKAKETGVSIGKSLRGALVGPLGIVIAVQVVVAAFEIFRKQQADAKKETDALTESIAKSAVELKLAIRVLDSENTSLENKNKVLDELNKKYPDWNLQHSKTGEISEDNRDKINNEIKAIENLAKARALQSVLEELYAEQAKMIAEREAERAEDSEGFFARVTNRFNNWLASTGFYGAEQEQKAFDESLNEITTKVDSVVGEFEKNPGLLTALIGGDKKGKVTKESRDKIKKLTVETYTIAIVEAEKERKRIQKAFKDMGLDYPSLILGGEEGAAALGEGILGLVDGLEETGYTERINEMMRNAVFPEDILKGASEMSGIINDVLESEANRAIDIEKNKTNALNNELKERLANEQLSAQERDKINQQISRNEAALVKRENEINKKRFQQEKAFSIAQAAINTYLAASDVLAREKGGLAAKIIGMTVVIASGLAQVAAIARQQFVAQALPSPNLVAQGGGPAESQGPAFNVVGASGQSQLAQVISAQTGQPVKAYVVAGEVSTAQSLERNRVKEASI